MTEIFSHQELFCNNGGVLVTHPTDVYYLSGLHSSNAVLLLAQDKKLLFTDTRYSLAAKDSQGFTVIEQTGELLEAAAKEAAAMGLERLSYQDGQLFAARYFILRSNFQGELRPLGDFFQTLRAIKTENELLQIGEAQRITDEAFSALLPLLRPGLTETEVAAEIEYQMRKRGAGGLAFETIVASGENSAKPHAVPGFRKLANGDFLTMDFGCTYQGYCSDMTRTVVIGKATPRHQEIYNAVLQAQTRGLAALMPGVSCREADAAARDYLTHQGYGVYFGHGLGHGVGLEIHESPVLNPRSQAVLKPGHVVTVEPGVYIPGFGGVRIEDLCSITEEGYHNFTRSDKHLIEI